MSPPETARGAWFLRELLRLYAAPFVLLAWALVPRLRARMMRSLRSSALVWKVFVEPFRTTTREAREVATSPAGAALDGKVVAVFVTAAVCLTLLEYFGRAHRAPSVVAGLRFLGFDEAAALVKRAMGDQLGRLTYRAVAVFACYFVVPVVVVKGWFRERLADYGLGLRGALKDGWIYVLLLGAVAPVIGLASFDAQFQQKYPFYAVAPGEALWPRFWLWEALYFSQFFALEFFYRGFLVHGLRRRLGYYSVLAMTVPYCMVHFGKPFPETLGAIVAGVVLGSLSLKTRSIWLGVGIHLSVALAMDLAALWQKGLL